MAMGADGPEAEGVTASPASLDPGIADGGTGPGHRALHCPTPSISLSERWATVEWAATQRMRLNKHWQLLIQVAVSGGPRVGVLGAICGRGQSQTEHRAGRSQGRALLLPRLEGRAGWRRGGRIMCAGGRPLGAHHISVQKRAGGLWGPASVLPPQAHQLPSLHSPEVVTVQEGPQCLAGR